MIKKIPSKPKIIFLASLVMMILLGGTRLSIMHKLDGVWIDFTWWDYAFRIINPFILSMIFLSLNLSEKKHHFAGISIDLGSKKWKILSNLVLFVLLHALFYKLFRPVDPSNGQLILYRAISGNAVVMISAVFIAWIYRLIYRNYQVYITNERLKKENAETKFEALKSQVNPHFLFNSFYTLNALIDEDPGKAKEFVNDLSDIYRYVLDTGEKNLVTLNQELAFARAYTDLLRDRFQDSIFIQQELESESLQKYIPPLSLQLLLENAVKHNAFDAENPLQITLRTNGTESLLVKNNLSRRTVSKKSSQLGLRNLNQRYKHLSNQEIVIKRSKDSFEVNLPLLDG